MGMLSPRLGTVFASRWKALWWAASILATAYCTLQSLPDGEHAQKPAKADNKPAPKNPWALDKKDAAKSAR